jgi:hypothetical protein
VLRASTAGTHPVMVRALGEYTTQNHQQKHIAHVIITHIGELLTIRSTAAHS